MILAIFCLTGCKTVQDSEILALQDYYKNLESLSLNEQIVLEREKNVIIYDFSHNYTKTLSTFTILEPTDLEGLTVTVKNGDIEFKYDDIVFFADELENTNISPLIVMQRVLDSWSGGFVTESKQTGNQIMLSFNLAIDDNNLSHITYFDKQTKLPKLTEVMLNNKLVMKTTYA